MTQRRRFLAEQDFRQVDVFVETQQREHASEADGLEPNNPGKPLKPLHNG
jgi:hypothetical protein